METYLGMDLGGTKLLIGEIDQNGQILRSREYPTGFKTQQETLGNLLMALKNYREEVGFTADIAAAGIGLLGTSDYRKGIWRSLSHLAGDNIPLGDILSRELGVPAALDNDVHSAATAELLWGHGRRTKDFIYLNVGTGLAAGLVADGRLIRGAHNISGEVGHMVLDLHSQDACGCGRKGCCESVVSGMGFTHQTLLLSPEYPESPLELPETGKRVNVARIFELADQGDPLCVRMVENAAKTLSCLILDLIRVTDPDTIVLGGGVVKSGWLLQKVNALLEEQTIMDYVTGGVVLSGFAPGQVGLIGAGAIASVKLHSL